MYGPLPENWEQFSTLQLKEYFSLQNRLNEGSITDIRNIYQFLPKDHRDDIEHSLQFHGHIFKKWLQKENHLFTCPVTNKEYATNFRSIDDLAEIPGFIDTLKNCIGKDNWILKVITSKKIQECALAEVI
jgi:hypothetical protein